MSSRVEKASEPSMEEILASIRKIISEEPAGSKPAAAPPIQAAPIPSAPAGGQPKSADPKPSNSTAPAAGASPTQAVPTAATAAPAKQQPVTPSTPEPRSPVDPLDEILDLAEEVPTRPPQARAGNPDGAGDRQPNRVPAWLAARPGADNSPAASAQQPSQPASARSFFPPLSRDAASPSPASRQPPASDLGAVVPGRNPSPLSSSGPSLPSPHAHRPMDARLLDAKPDAGRTAGANGELNRGAAAIESLRPADASAPQQPAPRSPDAGGLNGHRPAPRPDAQTEATADEQRARVPASPERARVEAPVVARQPSPAAPGAALNPGHGLNGQSLNGHTPNGHLQASAGADATPGASPRSGHADPLATALATAASASAARLQSPSPAPSASPASAPAPAVAADGRNAETAAAISILAAPVAVPAKASPASPEPEAPRSMEDTVAELLRPMLRQWLDNNMPRIVERALRVELAASAKPKVDPSKH